MNSDLTPSQDVTSTNNPQGLQGAPLANEASNFQQSAGQDILKQNRPVQVVNTGPPETVAAPTASNNSDVIIFVLISSVALLMLAVEVFRRVMRMPDTEKVAAAPVEEVAIPVQPKVIVSKSKKPVGKKKLPRSKRKK